MSRPVFMLALLFSAGAHLYMLGFGTSDIAINPLTIQDIAVIKDVVSVLELEEEAPIQESPPPVEPVDEPELVVDALIDEPEQQLVEAVEEDPLDELPLDDMFDSEPAPEQSPSGDFAGGSELLQQPVVPGLRIHWGDLANALSIMNKSGMKLVILEGSRSEQADRISPPIQRELICRDGQWHIKPLQLSMRVRYSNRLRIVHDVPAFRNAANLSSIRPDDRLAIMLPRDVEQMLEAAQLSAAYTSGLKLADIRNFAGQFHLQGKRLGFDVTQIQKKDHVP